MEQKNYTRKPIVGYEGLYEIDTDGVVHSVERVIVRRASVRNGAHYPQNMVRVGGGVVRGVVQKSGYVLVTLYDIEHKPHVYMLHRLVAEAFIPNPNNLPQVNHKDEDKGNNSADNLEWCTPRYNTNYSKARMVEGIRRGSHVRSVIVRRDNGEFVGVFDTMIDAARHTGVGIRYVSKCANGEYKKTHGYIFTLNNKENGNKTERAIDAHKDS